MNKISQDKGTTGYCWERDKHEKGSSLAWKDDSIEHPIFLTLLWKDDSIEHPIFLTKALKTEHDAPGLQWELSVIMNVKVFWISTRPRERFSWKPKDSMKYPNFFNYRIHFQDNERNLTGKQEVHGLPFGDSLF